MARSDDCPDRSPCRACSGKARPHARAVAARQGARGRDLGRRAGDRPRAQAGRRPAAADHERRHPVLNPLTAVMMPRPRIVLHADWSAHPAKRWLAAAALRADGRYRLLPTARIGPREGLWRSLEETGGAPALLGFDFPIGLPAAYAERAGIDDF